MESIGDARNNASSFENVFLFHTFGVFKWLVGLPLLLNP